MTGVSSVENSMSERLKSIFGSTPNPPPPPQQQNPSSQARQSGSYMIPRLSHGPNPGYNPQLPMHLQQPPIQPYLPTAGVYGSHGSSRHTPPAIITQGLPNSNPRNIMQAPNPQASSYRSAGQNVAHITPLHIASASQLHPDNPVRRLFAAAAVEGYLRDLHFPFLAETKDTPSFAIDLLRETQVALHQPAAEACYFVDPISGQSFRIGQ